MSYYITREVKLGEGENLSISNLDLNFNYLRVCEPSLEEVQSAEFILAGTRDKKRVAVLQEEAEVRMEFDLVGLKPLYWALGNVNDTVPVTITPASTLPWLTVARELEPVRSGESDILRIFGCKVESLELTFERGEVATGEITLMAKGGTIETGDLTVTVDYSYDPVYYSDIEVVVKKGGSATTISDLGRIVLTIDNNLSRRLSASQAAGYQAYHILEGGLDITGRMLVTDPALTFLQKVKARAGGNTVEIRINKSHGGVLSGTITMPNVWFTEYPERLRGIEPYEVEIPYVALPSQTENAIEIVCNTLTPF